MNQTSGAKKPGKKRSTQPSKGGTGTNMTTLNSYAEVQAYLTNILTGNISTQTGNNEESDSESAPHGAFWNTLTYDQFVKGHVPGVTDPTTGNPIAILTVYDSAHSTIIMALLGQGPLFDPNTGAFGQMPGDGPPFLTPAQVQPISAWIDAGCPQ